MIRLCLRDLAPALLCCAILAPPTAHAQSTHVTTGGVACKPASGHGAGAFYFSNLYAQNVTGSVQYLTCSLGLTSQTMDRAFFAIRNTTAEAGTVTCVLQAGDEEQATTVVENVHVPRGSGAHVSFESMPPRYHGEMPYTLSCALPPQWKLGILGLKKTT